MDTLLIVLLSTVVDRILILIETSFINSLLICKELRYLSPVFNLGMIFHFILELIEKYLSPEQKKKKKENQNNWVENAKEIKKILSHTEFS